MNFESAPGLSGRFRLCARHGFSGLRPYREGCARGTDFDQVAVRKAAHGGASEAAFKMLMEIGTVENIPKFIARAKDKNDPFWLMGFGHRVYKNYDPRAKIMQKTCHDVLNELGIKDRPLLDVAMELEKIALSDEFH